MYQGLVIFLGQYLVKQNLEHYNETKLLGRFLHSKSSGKERGKKSTTVDSWGSQKTDSETWVKLKFPTPLISSTTIARLSNNNVTGA